MANNGNSASKQPKPTKTPGKGKRQIVGVGDLVAFHSHIAHMSGNFGEVVAVIDKDHVVVRGMGAQYEDYDNRLWVLLTYKPTGINEDGEDWRDMHMWVRKVTYSRADVPPKRKKLKAAPTLIEGTEGLIAALRSDEKHDAVVFVPDGSK